MKLKFRTLKIRTSKFVIFLHESDAHKLGVHSGERVSIKDGKASVIGIVDLVSGFIHKGEVALSEEIVTALSLKAGEFVHVSTVGRPASKAILQRELVCQRYTQEELTAVIKDIVSNALSEAEIAYFVSGVYHCGLSLQETVYLTNAIVQTGENMYWGSAKVADKHSIGGIAGNRTTPIVVAICAAAGVLMPKTSSRAITAAAGTADVIESVARVDLSVNELKKIVKKTGACLAWGGSLGLAPADDKLIQIEKMLNLDPEPQLLASILAKKLAVGSKYVLIDIPCGEGAKVTRVRALSLSKKFIAIGSKLGLNIKTLITDGSQPIGRGIGPMLEMQDIVNILKRENGPKDLENKSLMLAGLLLEMVGKARKGQGKKKAKEILDSGAAFKKFEEIIKAQSGSLSRIRFGSLQHIIRAPKSGTVKAVHNKTINTIGRILGSPIEKTAGLYLHVHKKDSLQKGSPLVTLYSESPARLKEAIAFYTNNNPIIVE